MTVDWSKVGKKSRRKGKNFQNTIKDLISNYLDIPVEYIDQPIEWGGQPLGDLFVVGRFYDRLPIFIEAKKRETFKGLYQVFTNQNSNIFIKWWLKTSMEMPESEQLNLMLVFSRNHFPIFSLLPSDRLYYLIDDITSIPSLEFKSNIYDENVSFSFVLFKDFLMKRKEKLGIG